ncbi:LysR substrate-binding domain-containing protein [Paraburkholderia sp. IW21]|uniref:LysR substrate-binding domain-containing protein n=1 Tax=Paraburkholderia sp. IW21 TaxID=3242488 RepID=UPI0035226015
MWQIRQLEAFATVVRQGSITRAAQELNISQPAVSKLIATLECHCGFRLFARQGSRLTITLEGELLNAEVERMLAGTEQIRAKAVEIREKRFGTLHVAAFPSLASRGLATVMHGFIQHHPNVRPLLTSRSSQNLVEWVAAEKSDLGISLVADERPGVAFHRMMQVAAVCIMPPRHRLARARVVTPDQLHTEPYVALSTGDRIRYRLDEFFRGYEAGRTIVAEVQMSEAACQMVADGAGISIVEPFPTLGFGTHELLIKPISPTIYFDVWLVYPTYRPMSLIAKEFAYYLETELQTILSTRKLKFQTYPLDI